MASRVEQIAELLGECDAQEFEDVLLHMGEQARVVNQENRGAEDPAWDLTAACLQNAWIAVQERRGN